MKTSQLPEVSSFYKFSTDVMAYPKISFGAKCLLIILRNWAQSFDSVTCFPAQKTLAGQMGISVRQVQNYLTELKKNGIIDSTRRTATDNRGYTSNLYHFEQHEVWGGTRSTLIEPHEEHCVSPHEEDFALIDIPIIDINPSLLRKEEVPPQPSVCSVYSSPTESYEGTKNIDMIITDTITPQSPPLPPVATGRGQDVLNELRKNGKKPKPLTMSGIKQHYLSLMAEAGGRQRSFDQKDLACLKSLVRELEKRDINPMDFLNTVYLRWEELKSSVIYDNGKTMFKGTIFNFWDIYFRRLEIIYHLYEKPVQTAPTAYSGVKRLTRKTG